MMMMDYDATQVYSFPYGTPPAYMYNSMALNVHMTPQTPMHHLTSMGPNLAAMMTMGGPQRVQHMVPDCTFFH
jgi:hypothetical protein